MEKNNYEFMRNMFKKKTTKKKKKKRNKIRAELSKMRMKVKQNLKGKEKRSRLGEDFEK